MNTSERIREIWKSKPTPFYFVGDKAETREQLVQDITKKVMGLIRVPNDGKTPTKDNILSLIREVMPSEKDLLKLITPLIPEVKDGQDGKTPTDKELRNLIEPLIPKVKDGENGKTPTKAELESLIRPLILNYMEGLSKETPQLTYDQIKSVVEPIIRQMMTEARKGWFGGGGGGDNVRAGSGVTITTNNVGAKVISVSGGVVELTATGTINGSNTDFTFTEKPTYVVSDGAKYKENAGWTWNAGTLLVTMTVPPQFSIWGEK